MTTLTHLRILDACRSATHVDAATSVATATTVHRPDSGAQRRLQVDLLREHEHRADHERELLKVARSREDARRGTGEGDAADVVAAPGSLRRLPVVCQALDPGTSNASGFGLSWLASVWIFPRVRRLDRA